MGAISLVDVEKWFGDTQVIRGLSLHIEDGELVVFVGPSGCGKSTLLRMIAGLEDTSYGSILLDGQDVTDKIPSERELSMVFQSYALYPRHNLLNARGYSMSQRNMTFLNMHGDRAGYSDQQIRQFGHLPAALTGHGNKADLFVFGSFGSSNDIFRITAC